MTSPLNLYDEKGRPFVPGPGKISYYRDAAEKLIRVPSMFGPKSQIMSYLQVCFENGIDLKGNPSKIDENQIVDYLEEFWNLGEKNTVNILEMLNRKARDLEDINSVRSLMYKEVARVLRKLTIPIFNRRQLENIPNISRTIIAEVDLILKENIQQIVI